MVMACGAACLAATSPGAPDAFAASRRQGELSSLSPSLSGIRLGPAATTRIEVDGRVFAYTLRFQAGHPHTRSPGYARHVLSRAMQRTA